MAQQINLFEVLSIDEEVNKEFNDFFTKFDLLPLFTNEHRTGKITVTYTDARSVIMSGGSYNKELKKFKDVLTYAQDNKKYESAVFKIIYGVKTFQGLMNKIKKVRRYIQHEIQINHAYNTWNIVFYSDQLQ